MSQHPLGWGLVIGMYITGTFQPVFGSGSVFSVASPSTASRSVGHPVVSVRLQSSQPRYLYLDGLMLTDRVRVSAVALRLLLTLR